MAIPAVFLSPQTLNVPLASDAGPAESHVIDERNSRNRSRMAELSPAETQQTLTAWRMWMQQLMQSPSICSVAIFRNEGFSAGASLAYCHSWRGLRPQPNQPASFSWSLNLLPRTGRIVGWELLTVDWLNLRARRREAHPHEFPSDGEQPSERSASETSGIESVISTGIHITDEEQVPQSQRIACNKLEQRAEDADAERERIAC